MFDRYIYGMMIAAFITFISTPLVRALAIKIGAVDVPKDNRRVHTKPIPRMGGLAIYIGFMVTMMRYSYISKSSMMGIFLGSTILVILGIADDRVELSAKLKFAFQILAALCLVVFGIKIDILTNFINPSTYIQLGLLSVPLTVFWVVGITNTVNFIDGLDGLAAGISTIGALTLAYVAHANGRYEIAFMTLLLAGACIGFLPFNFNPAKIFMGDTGSMLLGFLLAAISIDGAIKGATAVALVVPFLALGLPIFYTAFAIFRRLLNNKPITEADKGHLHHRFLSIGFGHKKAVLSLYFISSLFGISTVFLVNNNIVNFIAIVLVAFTLILIPISRTIERK